jgi:hypothetical protein
MDKKKKGETQTEILKSYILEDFYKRLVCSDEDEPVISGRWFGDNNMWYHDKSKTLNWKRKNNNLNEIIKMKIV